MFFSRYIILVSLLNLFFTLGFCLKLYHNQEINLMLGLSSYSNSVIDSGLHFKDLYYTLSSRIDKNRYTKVVFSLKDPVSTANLTIDDLVEDAYLNLGDFRFGKQLMPFGSYVSHLITDTYTRKFEEIHRLGISMKYTYLDSFVLDMGVFNNEFGKELSSVALKFAVTPIKEIIFAQSIIYDQQDVEGKKKNRLDVHAMNSLHFGKIRADAEVYRGISGKYKDYFFVNGSLKVFINENDLSIATRLELANTKAASDTGKKTSLLLGVNKVLDKYSSLGIDCIFTLLEKGSDKNKDKDQKEELAVVANLKYKF